MSKLVAEKPGKVVPHLKVIHGTRMTMLDPTGEPAEGILKSLPHISGSRYVATMVRLAD